MTHPRTILAVWAGKAAGAGSRVLRRLGRVQPDPGLLRRQVHPPGHGVLRRRELLPEQRELRRHHAVSVAGHHYRRHLPLGLPGQLRHRVLLPLQHHVRREQHLQPASASPAVDVHAEPGASRADSASAGHARPGRWNGSSGRAAQVGMLGGSGALSRLARRAGAARSGASPPQGPASDAGARGFSSAKERRPDLPHRCRCESRGAG